MVHKCNEQSLQLKQLSLCAVDGVTWCDTKAEGGPTFGRWMDLSTGACFLWVRDLEEII